VTWSRLRELLVAGQASGELRQDFDAGVTAMAIRSAVDVVPHRLAADPGFDVGRYGRELADLFVVATRGLSPGNQRR